MSLSSGSGFVMYVTVSQTIVLAATVTSITTESARGSPFANRCGIVWNAMRETKNDAVIALISDHALMRHQYHRRISTRPVPAPSASRNLHACSTDESCDVTAIDARN